MDPKVGQIWVGNDGTQQIKITKVNKASVRVRTRPGRGQPWSAGDALIKNLESGYRHLKG